MARISKEIGELHLSAFTEKVQSQADNLFRFAYTSVLDLEKAYNIVKGVVEFAAKQMEAIQFQPEAEVKLLIFKECWQLIKNAPVNASSKTLTEQLGKLAQVKTDQRAMIILTDFIGFRPKDAADILGIDVAGGVNNLIVARKALVG